MAPPVGQSCDSSECIKSIFVEHVNWSLIAVIRAVMGILNSHKRFFLVIVINVHSLKYLNIF